MTAPDLTKPLWQLTVAEFLELQRAITQHNRTIIINARTALNLLNKHNSNRRKALKNNYHE